MIYPLPDTEENAERIQKYHSYLYATQDQYDFFNNGKRKGATAADYEKRRLQAVQEQEKRWRHGGTATIGKDPAAPEKISKYKANLHVKAKVDTGLGGAHIAGKDMNTQIDMNSVQTVAPAEGKDETSEEILGDLHDVVVEQDLHQFIQYI